MYPLPSGVRSALFVNLLTEDNLPYYTSTIREKTRMPYDHPLTAWSRRWTAEEGRHSIVIRDWVTVTRALDPKVLETGRMEQVDRGIVPNPETFTDMIAYVSFQEQATQVAHRNTGKMLGKEMLGSKVMSLVSGDEGLHYNFYRNLTKEAITIDPSTMVISIAKKLRSFRMPGEGIPQFKKHDQAIRQSGIFGSTELFKEVVMPTLNAWGIDTLHGLSAEAEAARIKIHTALATFEKLSDKEQVAREEFATT
jgi:acyl-[acyl-carrier-protein] desaturase